MTMDDIIAKFAAQPADKPYDYTQTEERLICHWFQENARPRQGPFKTYGEALSRAKSVRASDVQPA